MTFFVSARFKCPLQDNSITQTLYFEFEVFLTRWATPIQSKSWCLEEYFGLCHHKLMIWVTNIVEIFILLCSVLCCWMCGLRIVGNRDPVMEWIIPEEWRSWLHHSESMLMWNVTHVDVIHSVRFMNSVYVTDHPKRLPLILSLSPPSPCLSKWSWKLWILYLILKFFIKYLLYSLIGTYRETMDKKIKSEKEISIIFLETCMQTFGGLWLHYSYNMYEVGGDGWRIQYIQICWPIACQAGILF